MNQQDRETVVIVYDTSITWGKKEIVGPEAARDFSVNYKVLKRYIEDQIGTQVAQILHYSTYQENGRAAPFYDMLRQLGYTLNKDTKESLQLAKNVLYKLRELEHSTHDLFFVGGNFNFRDHNDKADSRTIGGVLLDLSESRKVSVAYFDSERIHSNDVMLREVLRGPHIEFHDLATDVGAVSRRIYKEKGNNQPHNTNAEQQNIGNIESKNTDVVVLVDGENIDGVLRGILQDAHGDSYLLGPKDRPCWDRVIQWLYNMYNEGKQLHILFFVPYKPTTRRFVMAIRDQNPLIKFVQLKPEIGSDADDPYKARSVVDDGINKTLEQLRGTWDPGSGLRQTQWDGDLYVLSHDNDFMENMQALNNIRVNADGAGKVSIVGFHEHLNGDYWMDISIAKIDLEYDMNAFSYSLPGRPKIISVDDYDATEFLPSIVVRELA